MPAMKTAIHCGIGHVFSKLIKEIGDPVDFELPDWLNKWQSMPYTFIKRNIYLTKKVKRRLEDDGIFCSCSSTAGTSAVCGKDCLCGIMLSSCSSGCKCGSSCLNKPFHQRPVKKMKLVKTEKCGSGIVADEDINRGDFVIEYVGEVIDDKTCEERLWKMKHSGETNFYLCEINRDMVIDATYKGNKSRYINHSCCPNTEMQKWMIDGEIRIGIFAARDIKRGEHLTYDYQFVQFGADQDCHCGAVRCRRKLGVKPNKPKLPASDAALKIVACQVAATSPKLKALLSTRPVYQTGVPPIGCSGYDSDIKIRRPRNCIGQIIRIIGSSDSRKYRCRKAFIDPPGKTCIQKKQNRSGVPVSLFKRDGTDPEREVLLYGYEITLTGKQVDDAISQMAGEAGKVVAPPYSGRHLSLIYGCTRSFGIIKRFDAITKKHLIMFEDGCVQYLDLSKEDWEFCNFLE